MSLTRNTLTVDKIRDETVARLLGKTAAGANVFKEITEEVQDDAEFPQIQVWIPPGHRDRIGQSTANATDLWGDRTMGVSIVCLVTATEPNEIRQAAFDLALSAQNILFSDPTWFRMFTGIDDCIVDVDEPRNTVGGRRPYATGVVLVTVSAPVGWEP